MDLREYLFRNRITCKAFSELVNYQRTYISKVIHGKIKPGRKLIQAIMKATNGQVSASDFTSTASQLCDSKYKSSKALKQKKTT